MRITSEETREKLRIALKGHRHSEAAKEKMRQRALASFRNGRKHSWTGKSLSEEWKENISKAMIGKKPTFGHAGRTHSDEAKRKIKERRALQVDTGRGKARPSTRGENHHNWKGGKTTQNLWIRNSLETKNWRRAVFERDNYTCQMCGKRGVRLNADHIRHFSTHPDLRFDVDNGRTLCELCHHDHHYGPKHLRVRVVRGIGKHRKSKVT